MIFKNSPTKGSGNSVENNELGKNVVAFPPSASPIVIPPINAPFLATYLHDSPEYWLDPVSVVNPAPAVMVSIPAVVSLSYVQYRSTVTSE